jgi:hypothetical protein
LGLYRTENVRAKFIVVALTISSQQTNSNSHQSFDFAVYGEGGPKLLVGGCPSGLSVFSGHDKLCQPKPTTKKKKKNKKGCQGIYFRAFSGQFGTAAHEEVLSPVLNLQPDIHCCKLKSFKNLLVTGPGTLTKLYLTTCPSGLPLVVFKSSTLSLSQETWVPSSLFLHGEILPKNEIQKSK